MAVLAISEQTRRLRPYLVDGPSSIGRRFRDGRWETFSRIFPGVAEMRIIDLGGTVEAWRRAPVRPRSVTVVNLHEPGIADDDWIVAVRGDACRARALLRDGGHRTSFDLVYCNSVIEHVGGHAQRRALANEVSQLAPRHWVQTPYRYFPIEPHWVCPLLQFLPPAAAARVAVRWPLAHSRPDSLADALDEVLWTELLGRAEMRGYFPESELIAERACGWTKSLIAVRTRG